MEINDFPMPGNNLIAFANGKGENNWFMNSVFQLLFNIDAVKGSLDAITLIEPKDTLGIELKKLVEEYNGMGSTHMTKKVQTVSLTKTVYKEKVGSTQLINITKFRREFSRTFSYISKMNETGDAMSFWSAIIQIINSLWISESSLSIGMPDSANDK